MRKNPLHVFENASEAIGFTPIIKMNSLPKEHDIKCQIFSKCDFMSVGGSSKDRIGYSMIVEAEKRGTIKPGDTIVEGSSGNTAIGLCLTAMMRGYKIIITIPDKMSDEKIDTLKALGAKVIVTPTNVSHDDPTSYTSVARALGKLPNHYYIDQYNNLDNYLAHVKTTSEEIWEQMEGKIDYIFVGIGTCGTVTGLGKGLHPKDPNIKIVGIDPHGSSLALPEELNTVKGSYKVEGIGQSIIPKNMDYSHITDFVKTDDLESFTMARDLIEKEGLLIGGSSGSVVSGAFRYLKSKGLNQNQNLRCVIFLPDSIRNYMSRFLTDSWMVGCGFYPTSKLRNPDHPLDHLTVADLKNLQPLPYYDARLTVNDCFDLFKKKHSIIPIRSSGSIIGVVTKRSLSTCVVDKKLHGMSSAIHCTQIGYLSVPFETSLSVIASMLRNEIAILAISKTDKDRIKSIYIVTQNDILESMHELIKEVI